MYCSLYHIGCDCYTEGTSPDTLCNRTNGQCVCRDHVTGRRCNQCEEGYWNMTSSGYVSCNCDTIGSAVLTCDQVSFSSHGNTTVIATTINSYQADAHVVMITLV